MVLFALRCIDSANSSPFTHKTLQLSWHRRKLQEACIAASSTCKSLRLKSRLTRYPPAYRSLARCARLFNEVLEEPTVHSNVSSLTSGTLHICAPQSALLTRWLQQASLELRCCVRPCTLRITGRLKMRSRTAAKEPRQSDCSVHDAFSGGLP